MHLIENTSKPFVLLGVYLDDWPQLSCGGFCPAISNYYLDGYSNQIIPEELYENFDTMRYRRSRYMPLPTRSFSFILQDSAPMNEAERLRGYPFILAGVFYTHVYAETHRGKCHFFFTSCLSRTAAQ